MHSLEQALGCRTAEDGSSSSLLALFGLLPALVEATDPTKDLTPSSIQVSTHVPYIFQLQPFDAQQGDPRCAGFRGLGRLVVGVAGGDQLLGLYDRQVEAAGASNPEDAADRWWDALEPFCGEHTELLPALATCVSLCTLRDQPLALMRSELLKHVD
jgi:hypothetical protein